MVQPWTIRRLMWGALLIWIGIMGVVDEPAGMASIGAGVILLLGALVRKAAGLHAGFVLTIAGILLLVFGLRNLGGEDNDIPLLAVAAIGFGAFIIARAIGVGRRPGGGITVVRYHGGQGPPHV